MPPPPPSAAETPAAVDITGPSFAGGGGHYFASPTNKFSDVSSESPAPFKLPTGYKAGTPVGCISSHFPVTDTKEHGEPFYEAPNGQLWYKAPDDKPIYMNEGAPDVQFSVKDRTGTEYSPDRNNPPKTKLETWLNNDVR